MTFQLDNKDLLVKGRFPRIMRLGAEYFEWVDDPNKFIVELKKANRDADLFTFVQKFVPDMTLKYDFYYEWERIAVLPISTYEKWWNQQIRHETRVKIRKALKRGIDVRLVELDDDLVRGIKNIYDESPIRQGKRFGHYQKSLEVLKREHSTFLNRSQFIGAFYNDELIGFVKIVHDEGLSAFMHVISMIGHRDKAPTNALVAKAVAICAEQGVPYLQYGAWSQRGLGDFKINHAFEPVEVPRYFIPLNLRGKLALILKLHRKMYENLPQKWIDFAVECRNKWNIRKFASSTESARKI